ncbi:tetratricopeptide repeat protein [Halobacteriovorax sp. RZ-2]|uniref:tetratricopeptide repeat protein n=1 Tax=unclassified Halobacteriovorax TaxID=2639665 RepID=UPI00371DEC22
MFKIFIKNSLCTVALVTLVGCATTSSVKDDSDSKINEESQLSSTITDIEKARRAQEFVDQSLSEIVEEAKTKGEATVNFIASDLFLKAADASLSGDSVSASLILKHVVELKPKDIYLRKKYAVELIKSSQLEDGKKELEYLIKHADKEIKVKAKLLLAGVYGALGSSKKSIKLYRQLVYKTKPILSEACIYLSKAYVDAKKFKKAVGTLSYCSKKDRDNRSDYAFHKGKIYFEKSDYKNAKKYFNNSLKLDPTNQQSTILLGMIYEQEGNFNSAKLLYHKFLKYEPSNYTALGKYVNLLFSDGEYEKVVPYLEKLLALDPENLNLKVRLGVIYTETERIEDAKGIFKEILSVIPDSDKVLYYLASLYQKSNEGDLAVTYFSRIKEDSSLFHESNIQIANILNTYAQKDRSQEKRFVEFVKERSKASKELRFELEVILAGYYENRKDLGRAIALMESQIEHDSYTDGHAYYLASLYEKDKAFTKAEKIMLDILKRDPNNSHALNFLGYTYLEQGVHMDKAYAYIKRAVQLNPQDGYIRDSLGWYYYKTGEYQKAYREIKKAFALVSDDVVIAKHLGLIYTSLKKPEKARQYYVEALKNCTKVNEREEILNYIEKLDSVRLPASR